MKASVAGLEIADDFAGLWRAERLPGVPVDVVADESDGPVAHAHLNSPSMPARRIPLIEVGVLRHLAVRRRKRADRECRADEPRLAPTPSDVGVRIGEPRTGNPLRKFPEQQGVT